MTVPRELPVRMCVVVPLESGRYQAFCIACKWQANPSKSKKAAEDRARRHECPRPPANL